MSINKAKLVKKLEDTIEHFNKQASIYKKSKNENGCLTSKAKKLSLTVLLNSIKSGEFDESTEDSKDKLGSCKWCGTATNNEFYCSEECDKEDEEYCKSLME